ncbi:MAG: hypothetical protein KatS3mg102_2797 [Planctomycetota bacterium]|nr:MAG: hypothetical protein KatS3mg102_2797 [Planctomycetota bacterium]
MHWLLRIDRRLIYALVAIAIGLPTLWRFRLPIAPSPPVEGVHSAIEALEPGQVLLASLDFDPASAPELEPMSRAVLRHAFRKRLRVIAMTHWPQGVGLANQIVEQTVREFDEITVAFERFASRQQAEQRRAALAGQPLAEALGGPAAVGAAGTAVIRAGAGSVRSRSGAEPPAWSPALLQALGQAEPGSSALVEDPERGWYLLAVRERTPSLRYGEDYVFLGQRAGLGILIVSMGQSMHAAFPADAAGRPTREMPVFRGVETLGDVDYLICLAAGNSGEAWVAYGAERYKFPMGIGCTAVIAPDLYPYWQAGQITGIVGGVKGAWEYEHLIGIPAQATEMVPAQTVAHMVVIALIAICNLGYFLSRRRGGAR